MSSSEHQVVGGVQAVGVCVAFAGLTVLDEINLEVRSGEILGLIGPNGAGKTTLVNVLTGYVCPTRGSVLLGGREVTGLPPHKIARAGLSRTFQAVRPFGRLTVAENVEAAALGLRMGRAEARRSTAQVLERFGLADSAEVEARALPYGLERSLGLARAVAAKPTFLLLDEPAAGLDEVETGELLHLIRAVRDDYGCGVLVIEHDMPMVMSLCERVQVIDRGRTLAVGTPAQVRADEVVQRSFLSTTVTEEADAAG